MEKDEKPASAEELLRRIQELQKRHAHIKQEISQLKVSGEPLAMKLTETQYLNILHSMGQAIFIYDINHRIIFWNRGAEDMYGYTSSEVIGRSPTELLAEPKDALLSEIILERTVKGESWCGEFPIKNKSGHSFVVICANTPYRDENRILLGAMCVSSDSRPYQVTKIGVSVNMPTRTSFDSRQPLQTSIASKISNLASKVKLKMRVEENYTDHKGRSDISSSPIGVFFSAETEEHFMRKLTLDSCDESKNKHGICKILSSKAEEWMGKKGISWPWKENETENESVDSKLGHVGWHLFNVNQAYQHGPQMSSAKLDCQLCDTSRVSSNRSTCRSNSDDTSIKSNVDIKVEGETDIMDYEILWEDLITKEQIGQGSCGTVYRGLWYGSDVALKLFLYREFSDDVIVSFIQEVSLMKRLRHPNILLFMGAVTSPQHLCIVTEFLPRGSLFRILQRNTTRLDWRRRIHMAMDIARGMNYLHCYNPPIVHRDLKSSNLLVDKNWTVKVADFGLSRIRNQTYPNISSGKGTPQWMAPEIIRNEQADEKSDVYSYGVVMWEITTEKIPWDDLNPMQVIAAVGFMNRKLEIPKDVDPLWASLIESCCSSEPQSRPTFQEILYTLKNLQKKFAIDRRR